MSEDLQKAILGALLGICIAVPSVFLEFLTVGGAAATVLLATIVYGVGGWAWTLPILLFFLLSSLLSRNRHGLSNIVYVRQYKPGARDGAQVLANGGIPSILGIVQWLYPGWSVRPT